jgi:hypothetical protein
MVEKEQPAKQKQRWKKIPFLEYFIFKYPSKRTISKSINDLPYTTLGNGEGKAGPGSIGVRTSEQKKEKITLLSVRDYDGHDGYKQLILLLCCIHNRTILLPIIKPI